MPSSSWFAAYTRPRHEKKVQEYARQLELDNFLPVYQTMHRWRNGVNKKIELPLFPGYIFIRFDLRDRLRIIRIPGIISLVGSGPNSSPVPDCQIEQLRTIVSSYKAEPHPFIKTGDKVLIKSGPLHGLEGVVVRKKGAYRFVISLDFIMRSVSLEVDAFDLEQLPASYPKLRTYREASLPGA